MTEIKQIEAFNQSLDAFLRGDGPDLSELPEDDRQAIYIATRLADIDLSPQSKQRYELRRKLSQDERRRAKTALGLARRLSSHSSPALLVAFPSATLLFVLAFVLSWAFTNLGRLPAYKDSVSATAFAIPGTSIESGLPPSAGDREAQAFAPQPLPTPIAPHQFIEYTPSTAGPDGTPPLTSQWSSQIGVTRVSP
jgi:hypothetical protein